MQKDNPQSEAGLMSSLGFYSFASLVDLSCLKMVSKNKV